MSKIGKVNTRSYFKLCEPKIQLTPPPTTIFLQINSTLVEKSKDKFLNFMDRKPNFQLPTSNTLNKLEFTIRNNQTANKNEIDMFGLGLTLFLANKVRWKTPTTRYKINITICYQGWEGGKVFEDSILASSREKTGLHLWLGNRQLAGRQRLGNRH